MPYEQKFLLSLLLTLVVETSLVFYFLKYICKSEEIKSSKIIFTGLAASALTMPYFWFVLPFYVSDRIPYIFLGEGLIVFIEAIIYKQFLQLGFLRAIVTSLIANVVSAALGLIINI